MRDAGQPHRGLAWYKGRDTGEPIPYRRDLALKLGADRRRRSESGPARRTSSAPSWPRPLATTSFAAATRTTLARRTEAQHSCLLRLRPPCTARLCKLPSAAAGARQGLPDVARRSCLGVTHKPARNLRHETRVLPNRVFSTRCSTERPAACRRRGACPTASRRCRTASCGAASRAADRALVNLGITFNVYGDDAGTERIFPFDIVPRIVAAAEWSCDRDGA